MAINAREAKSNGTSIEPIEPGSYPARLVQVIDFGLQPQSYLKEEKPPMQEIGTTYELLDEFLKDEDGKDQIDKPRWLTESFALHNIEADRAKSTQRYYALDPKEQYKGDWGKLIGTPVIITVINKAGSGKNKGKTYSNIASTSAMRSKEAGNASELVNAPVFFDLTDVSASMLQIYSDFPQWIKDKINKGLEWQGSDFQIALENFKPKEKADKGSKKKPVEVVEEDEPDAIPQNW